ncbi:MAG: MaoC/PaaZ C-terminal domain-containing protein [Planctomycetota bacterium]
MSLDLQPEPESASVASTPLAYEDLRPGANWTSPEREISGDDVAEFAVLTGDDDPLHTDPSAPSPFGQPVAHGLLGLSVMAGLSVDYPRVATLALVEIRGWSFSQPIFFGDRVRVRTTVESITPHGRRAGRVVWRRELVNQDDRIVQSGQIVTLVSRQRPSGRSHAASIRSSQNGGPIRRSSMPPR